MLQTILTVNEKNIFLGRQEDNECFCGEDTKAGNACKYILLYLSLWLAYTKTSQGKRGYIFLINVVMQVFLTSIYLMILLQIKYNF